VRSTGALRPRDRPRAAAPSDVLGGRWRERRGIPRAHRGTAVLRRPFTAAERSALDDRVWSLSCAVAPPQEAHRNALLAAITGMLGAFPMMQRHDELTALAIAASYLWSAREQPHWAILKATWCGLGPPDSTTPFARPNQHSTPSPADARSSTHACCAARSSCLPQGCTRPRRPNLGPRSDPGAAFSARKSSR
jgi:hypothetical protein